MAEEYKSQLFRLAAVLYADNNYEVKPITIHKKIIESAFRCTVFVMPYYIIIRIFNPILSFIIKDSIS